MFTVARSKLTKNQVLFLSLFFIGAISSVCLAGCSGLVSSGNTAPATTPQTSLTVTNVSASNATTTSVLVNWTTSLAANSEVDYETTAAYGDSTPVNAAMVTSHQINLASLTA